MFLWGNNESWFPQRDACILLKCRTLIVPTADIFFDHRYSKMICSRVTGVVTRIMKFCCDRTSCARACLGVMGFIAFATTTLRALMGAKRSWCGKANASGYIPATQLFIECTIRFIYAEYVHVVASCCTGEIKDKFVWTCWAWISNDTCKKLSWGASWLLNCLNS